MMNTYMHRQGYGVNPRAGGTWCRVIALGLGRAGEASFPLSVLMPVTAWPRGGEHCPGSFALDLS